MKAEQLSLFPSEQNKSKPTAKKAKLGRYERLQRELENNDNDPYKIYIDVDNCEKLSLQYNFVDLFSGAGGITKGLSQAGFNPVVSVEINPIASATHERNFPNCHHFCGDIQEFKSEDW